jgi:hypothetical protein
MYLIGNATCALSVKMWEEVIGILQRRDQIGHTLRLRCPRHPDKMLIVSKPEDFEVVAPEGGCSELCGQRLNCGHSCEFLCHAEVRHRVAGCRKPCERGRPECGHSCSKACSDPCGNCNIVIKNVRLPCGHDLPRLECWQAQDLSKSKPRCLIRVRRTLSRCGHEVEMECWQSPDDFKCKQVCGGLLKCRHQFCAHPCHKCSTISDGVRQHAPCRKLCDKDFTTCSHRCARTCHSDEDCGLCEKRCELRCIHSQCPGKCGENCVPCAERCTWSCEHHGSCKMPCGVPCDRLPCNLRCDRVLDCGHRCPSICGENCPSKDFCQECCTSEFKERVVDYLEFTTYQHIDLDADPIVVLPCNHFYSRSSLDKAMEIGNVYVIDKNDQFVESIPNGSMTVQKPQCLLCRSPVSKVQRYNRVIKRYVLDTLLKNIISRSQVQYLDLVTSFDKFRVDQEAKRDEKLRKLHPIRDPVQKRPHSTQNKAIIVEYQKAFDPFKEEIRGYLKDVDESRQPHSRVYRMSIAAQSRAKTDVDGVPGVYWPSDVPSPDVKHRILGTILQYRLEVLRNADMIQFADRLSSLKDDATLLYQKVIKDCSNIREKSSKIKTECDEQQYYSLAVELMLLEIELLVLSIRASIIVDKSNTLKLRDVGLQIWNGFERYFRAYKPCRKYEPAAIRAKEMLRNLAGPFYETVSQEERAAICQAMRGDFGSAVRWYYCRNGHPV